MASRRGRNEGTIFKRADGRWVGKIRVAPNQRKEFYGRTRREVAEKLTTGLKAVQDGMPLSPERVTFGNFVITWLGDVKSTLRPRTHERYESLLRLHALPGLGRVKLSKVTPDMLQRLYTDRIEAGLAPSTVAQLHRVLHRMLDHALRWGLTPRNPSALVRPPRVPRQEIRILEVEQAATLLRTVSGDRLEAVYVLALHTGMRQGELFGLQWNAVDLDDGSLRVDTALHWTRDGWQLVEPKTPTSRRKIPLNVSVTAALRRHRAKQSEEALRLGPAWQDTGLVFTNRAGGPLSPQNFLRREFYPTLIRAGVPRITFHQLRHTAASLVIAAGVPIPQVSRLLGHADSVVTMRIYAHALPSREREATDALHRAIGAS
jgi:integrase